MGNVTGVSSAPETASSRRERLGAQRQRHKREQRVSFTVYGVSLVVLGLLIPVLGLVGLRTLLNSRDGELLNPVLDPSQPRYQAMVPPSPTLLVLQLDPTETVVGAALLTLPTFESPGGSVLLLPTLLTGDIPEVGEMPIQAAYAFSGLDAARSVTEWALHLGIERAVAISATEWTELIAATGPLEVVNPDTLHDADHQVIYAPGELTLEPADVPAYAAHLDENENHLNRLLRQELVWNAWLSALAVNPSVLGEFDFGNEQTDILSLGPLPSASSADEQNGNNLSDDQPNEAVNDADLLVRRFMSQLGAGDHTVVQAPLIVDANHPSNGSPSTEPGELTSFRLDHDQMARLVPRIIPFPAGYATNTRPLVKVLDGSGDQSMIPLVARLAIEVGGQVSMIGNAENFDFTTTEIMYAEESWRPYVETLQETLGFGTAVKLEDMDENSEVVVLIGSDAKS